MKAMQREISDYLEVSCGVKSKITIRNLTLVIASLLLAIPIGIIWLALTIGYIPDRGGGRIYPGSFSYDFIVFGLVVMGLCIAHIHWLTLFGDKKFKYYVLFASGIVLLAFLFSVY